MTPWQRVQLFRKAGNGRDKPGNVKQATYKAFKVIQAICRRYRLPENKTFKKQKEHFNNINIRRAPGPGEMVVIMCEIKIALTNLGKYNEGILDYIWLELPGTDDDIQAAFKAIGVSDEPDENGNYYEEFFITDYECDFYEVGEYENLEELNEIAETLEDLEDYERDIVKALLNEGYTLEDALDTKDDCIVWPLHASLI